MPEDQNDAQAQALVEALAPKIAEAILPQIADSVEGQIKGLKDKSTELLDKLAKTKSPAVDDAALTAKVKELLEAAPADTKTAAAAALFATPGAIQLTRQQARDPKLYRAAKAQAEKDGKTVEIVSE